MHKSSRINRLTRSTRLLRMERLEDKLPLSADWHNLVFSTDVTNDGEVAPIDALQVINEINLRRFTDAKTGRLLGDRADSNGYLDVNNDGFVSPLDAVRVINHLNNTSPALVATISDQSGTEDIGFELDVRFAFDDSDAADSLEFTAPGLPVPLSINDGVISGIPTDATTGTHDITVIATDRFGSSVSDTFTLSVANVNDPPSVGDVSTNVVFPVATGATIASVDFIDEDLSDDWTFTISAGDPDGIFEIHPRSGEITVLDQSRISGEMTVQLVVTVTDLAGESNSGRLELKFKPNSDPIAVADSGFAVLDRASVAIPFSDILDNDTDPDGHTVSVLEADTESWLGATVRSGFDKFSYDASSSETLRALDTGEIREDHFYYTITDELGATSRAKVTVSVTGTNIVVGLRLDLLDSNGNTTTTVAAEEEFTLVAYAEDLRDDAQGIFATYMDVAFDDSAISAIGSVVHAEDYPFFLHGRANGGRIHNAGGSTHSLSPPGGGVVEIFRHSFVAGPNPDTVTFSVEAADADPPFVTLLYGWSDEVGFDEIEYGSVELVITE